MKRLLSSFMPAFFCLLTTFVNAQNVTVPKDVKKTFYYSFENVSSDQQIESLKRSVSFLQGVSEVKSEYKSEKAMGQIIVVVFEKQRSQEGDKEFDVTSLKKAIIQNQLTPLELKEEEVILEN